MKTKELVAKYQKLIGGLLKVDPEHITFKVLSPKNHGDYIPIGGEISYAIDKDKDGQQETVNIDWCVGKYIVTLETEEGEPLVASFELYQMPHCCGIIVSCRANVVMKYRNKRVGTTLNNLRQDIGRMLGYSLMLCTDIDSNECQKKLLKTNGWTDIYKFLNRRTNNAVSISVINL